MRIIITVISQQTGDLIQCWFNAGPLSTTVAQH